MTFLKWYSIIILTLVDIVLIDDYIKGKTIVSLMSFVAILPIILYLLVR